MKRKAIPDIKRTQDFLQFADRKTYPIDEFKYSNLGLLLVGLAIEHICKGDYYTILRKHILDKAGISCFSPHKPENAKYNRDDPALQYVVGGLPQEVVGSQQKDWQNSGSGYAERVLIILLL